MTYRNSSWFFGKFNAKEAETLLSFSGTEGSFLVRESSVFPLPTLVLSYSIKRDQVLRYNGHRYILTEPSGAIHLKSDDKTFSTVKELIKHLRRCKNHGLPLLISAPKLPIVVEKLPTSRSRNLIGAAELWPKGQDVSKPNVTFHGNRSERSIAECAIHSTMVNKEVRPESRSEAQNIEVDVSEINIGECIGQGSFGRVHKGIFRQKAQVAIKFFHNPAMNLKTFVKETSFIATLEHVNVVRLCGVCTTSPPFFIVNEFMDHGSLDLYLARHKSQLLAEKWTLRRICGQVCFGMEYLESKNVIHKELATRNCLVSGGVVKVGKIVKFSSLSEDYTNAVSRIPMAPEVKEHRLFSSKSDVWSFGAIMWEVFSGGKEHNYNSERYFKENDFLLPQPKAANELDYIVMKNCWKYIPDERPAFHYMASYFKAICIDD